MTLPRLAACLLPLMLASAQPPLPELKVEATDGGSALRVKNSAAQPLTAYLIEMVGYPGSSYAFYHEGIPGRTVAPATAVRIPITNMTVGASPEYVHMQAAVFADGAAAGAPDKVAQLLALRRTTLETTRELITRLAKGGDKAALAESLQQWADSIPAPTKRDRGTPAAINRSTQRDAISATAAQLAKASAEDLLNTLKATAAALAASKPAL
jgi:hypothetical protein